MRRRAVLALAATCCSGVQGLVVPTEQLEQVKPPAEAGKARIDYSAATEYVQAHYGIHFYLGEPSVRDEVIFDARKGVLDEDTNHIRPARLDECGFEVFTCPTQVTEFNNMRQVSSIYLNELRQQIPLALGVSSSAIDSVIFWHPMLRGEGGDIKPRSEAGPSTAGVASMVHMDTDVGAYGVEGMINLVRKNRVVEEGRDNNLDWQHINDCLENRLKRLVLLNIWRPLHPVSSAPLGVWATRYDDTDCNEKEAPNLFPYTKVCLKSSRWYMFSNMQPSECLIFKQFDRDLEKSSDLWHCSLDLKQTVSSNNKQPRKSFDVKAMVILNQDVPPASDRLALLSKPLLTLQQSGEFCNSQAANRQLLNSYEN